MRGRSVLTALAMSMAVLGGGPVEFMPVTLVRNPLPKRFRPRNLTRSTKRTDFSWRIEQAGRR